jgi:predicted RNA-binding protein YlxR (DUF448 family)
VGCGRRAPKSALLRLRAAGDEDGPRRLVVDRSRAAPGRGAYLCLDPSGEQPRSDCLERALRRRAFPRALRCAVQTPRLEGGSAGPLLSSFIESTF